MKINPTTMKIDSTLIFLNITAQFSVLDGLCKGESLFQAIIGNDGNKNGKLMIEELEPMDISNITFAGNEINITQYGFDYNKFKEWSGQVNNLFNCDISDLIYKDAAANVDKKALLEYINKIYIPNPTNSASDCDCECNGCC